MSKRINTRICNKHDLEVNWRRTEDFIPFQGELIIYDREIDSAGNILELPTAFTGRVTPYTYERVKVGDGITDVKDLPFLADDSLATDLTGHADNTVIHITSPERSDWNAAKVHADSEHAPIEAQENLIEVITVNGNVQSIEGKTVNLTVPATPDEIGAAPSLHNHDDAYDKKGASTEALTSAQAYTDSVTATIKNDLTDELQEAVEEESIRAQSIENLIKVMLADKVDKVAGKVLSSNDFTIEEKLKLASLTAFSIDNELSDTSDNPVQNKVITTALDNVAQSIPTQLSKLTNDKGYVTESELNQKGYLTQQSLEGYATEDYVDNAIAAIPEPDLSEYAKKSDIPEGQDLSQYAKKTDIPDVSDFISEIPSEYITESELEAKKYLTEHQSLAGYATESFVTNKIAEAELGGGGSSEPIDLSGYATKDDIKNFITEESLVGYATEDYVTEAIADKIDTSALNSAIESAIAAAITTVLNTPV